MYTSTKCSIIGRVRVFIYFCISRKLVCRQQFAAKIQLDIAIPLFLIIIRVKEQHDETGWDGLRGIVRKTSRTGMNSYRTHNRVFTDKLDAIVFAALKAFRPTYMYTYTQSGSGMREASD